MASINKIIKLIILFIITSFLSSNVVFANDHIFHPHSKYLTLASTAKLNQKNQNLLNSFNSKSAFLVDHSSNSIIYSKNSDQIAPIASLTKLMTAMVVLDSQLDLNKIITISEDDIDYLKNSRSYLFVGFRIRRIDAMLLMLMSSDNRAASALARYYPTGKAGFIKDMNAKAKQIGMNSTNFEDPSGLSEGNVSNARDLALMVTTANNYPLIRQFSTTPKAMVHYQDQTINFINTNPKIRDSSENVMKIILSKTGYIRESGFCLAMTAYVGSRPITIILMDAKSRRARLMDIAKISKWANEML